MNKRVTIQFADFIKSRLAGGLLCCLVLLAAYLFQMFFPGMYVDAFSSSFYLFAWLILFVGALLWTLREKGTSGLPSEITDWQCIAAFLLIVANQIYVVIPKLARTRDLMARQAPSLISKIDKISFLVFLILISTQYTI